MKWCMGKVSLSVHTFKFTNFSNLAGSFMHIILLSDIHQRE